MKSLQRSSNLQPKKKTMQLKKWNNLFNSIEKHPDMKRRPIFNERYIIDRKER